MASGEEPRREGNAIVVPRQGARLPSRCVRCNAPAEKFLTRRLSWHHQALYLLILIGVCVYVIPALIFRKQALVEVGLCEKHFKRRRIGMLVGWLGFIVDFVLFFLLVEKYPAVGLIFLLVAVVTPIVGAVMARVVTAKKMDENSVWLLVGRPFLDSIQ
jgi:hypothetical protein